MIKWRERERGNVSMCDREIKEREREGGREKEGGREGEREREGMRETDGVRM